MLQENFENQYFVLTPARPLNKAGYITASPNIIEDSDCPPYSYEEKLINNPQRMFYCFGKGTSKSPIMIDYHPPLVSEKIYSVLSKLNISGLQLIPATIRGKGKEYEYWYLHIYNAYPVLDLEKSECKWDEFIEVASPIETIVFKAEELQKIKQEDRLIFCLAENRLFFFFHKIIVDELMKIEPKSFTFIEVSKYGEEEEDF